MYDVTRVRAKWRPSIALVVVSVCFALISVPLVALLGVRLTSNQFVSETEQALIQQGALYAQLFATLQKEAGGLPVGPVLGEDQQAFWSANLHPARAQLNVRTDPVLPSRPSGVAIEGYENQPFQVILPQLRAFAQAARKTTLTGVVFLDHEGATQNDQGAMSFKDLPEVATALRGTIGSVLRSRGDDFSTHSFASLSRDTGYRVFVTFPVVSEDRVIGVVYLSRTPLNLGKFLYQERFSFAIMLLATMLGAAVIGYLLIRLMSRPVLALRDRAQAIAAGRMPTSDPLQHYGTAELAELGQSMLTMADSLSRQSSEIKTYTDHVTHELKSPVTAILGAAELLQSGNITDVDRAHLLANIEFEGTRMNRLLAQLREMTRVDVIALIEPGKLQDMLADVGSLEIELHTPPETILPLCEKHGKVIFHHMMSNAADHGATRLSVSYQNCVLHLRDDGTGIDAKIKDRLSEPFFTTRRDHGGTGMGLAIVSAILDKYGATIVAVDDANGAHFQITFPPTGVL